MDRQLSIDQQIATSNRKRKFEAWVWLLRHLAGIDAYEECLLIGVLTRCGTKYRSAWLSEDEARRAAKCGRSQLYEVRRRLQEDGLLSVGELRDGRREYTVSAANLVGLLPVEDQRRYYRILDPHGGLDALAESTTWTRRPRRGREVHDVDAAQCCALYQDQEINTPPPPPPPESASTAGADCDWRRAEEEVIATGMTDWCSPMRKAQQSGVSAEHVIQILQHWRKTQYGLGALHRRLGRSHPALPPDLGWPDKDPERKKTQRRKEVQTDDTVAEIAWQTVCRKMTGSSYEQRERVFLLECERRGITKAMALQTIGVAPACSGVEDQRSNVR